LKSPSMSVIIAPIFMRREDTLGSICSTGFVPQALYISFFPLGRDYR
jgi:hypothetical protein